MNTMPVSVQQPLRRLARRLAVGLFLDVWPPLAVAGLLLAGLVVLICRLFVPAAAPRLPWLWLAPVLVALPALVMCRMRAYRPAEIVALADSLTGGHGTLMALHETNDLAWRESALSARQGTVSLPRLRPWRQLAALTPALAFMAATFWLPQRLPQATDTLLADDMAGQLTATLAELKQQELITPVEEQRLEDEIARIRRGAEARVDASSWEAADALRDTIVAGVSEKLDAVKWAEESLARYTAASQGAAGEEAAALSDAQRAELMAALERLSQRGLLAGAPADVQRMLARGKLPTDAAALRTLMDAVSKHLADTNARITSLARRNKAFGRFDPSEFPVESGEPSPDGDARPGSGAVNRGRADAPLTWGKESSPFDRFKAMTLPPGAARSPEDWAPVAELPGAPEVAAAPGTASAARQYAAAAGQSAWRRTLAPRHQSAVKNYFAK